MSRLLVEIGAEEIPAGYIEPALEAFSSKLKEKLKNARIEHGNAKIYGTPRRLAVEIEDVALQQKAVKTEVTGPPEKVGFDENGNQTVAAEKFAQKVGVDIKDIKIKQTKKGRYLCAEKEEPAEDSEKILKEILPEIVASVPFPKTMRWGTQTVTFTRPVHWIVAILGTKVISFDFGDVTSGNTTYGHRFMAPSPIEISSPEEYVEKLKKAYVIADLDERRAKVKQDVEKVAKELGGRVLPDEELVDIVKNLVEYPVVTGCRFDEEFLEVPDEVLITAMREHQKYFSVVDEKGSLMSGFVVVNNTETRDMKLVATGHERVIRARLSDAKFFYKGDTQVKMDSWVEKLKGVLFQAKLGSMYEKVKRVRDLAGYLANEIDPSLVQDAQRAAWLCKADLVSQVVVEFPKLQGVMGRIYAALANEPGEIPLAIEEHYRPVRSGGALPDTTTGSLLAISDKTDSICGCFCVGLIPSGGADPYALRRQGIGIIQIMKNKGFSFSLKSLIQKSVSLFAEKHDVDIRETTDAIYTFLKNRISNILADQGFSKDVILAVADVSIDHIPNVWERVKALEKLKSQPDFEPLAVAFKRVVNIIKKSGLKPGADIKPDENFFEDDSEKALYSAFNTVKEKVFAGLEKGEFENALREIASLRSPVDAFFDGVMVMADDEKLRNNRLALLSEISGLFGQFADFSKISV